ncbi:unnamed protein product [Miscanthus lutarioriparius]|uniref:Uncharacterized protein n=1 Tax=Miscanthus lutarioriparius TaxID=422564 RepID=A0A811S6J9_9POAL|nr:unnamed protein product [Miscanthus lutarioriparius]
MRSKFVAAVMLTAVVVMALVSTSCSARPLATAADAAGMGAGDAAAVSGKQILQLLRRLYLQQLGAAPSCQTNSSNGGCPTPSSG